MGGVSITIKDVARRANVSVATVSRALNGHDHVAESVRQRILSIAGELDYSPDHAARALSSRRTRTIGVVLPDLPCEFFARLMCGVDAAARECGLQLLVSGHHQQPGQQGAALRAMRGRVDGLLLMSPHAGVEVLAANLPGSLPVLLLDPDAQEGGFSALCVDHYGGARTMMRHLADSGRRRIAFIAGREPHVDARERLRGYRDAMAELLPGVPPQVVAGDFDVASGHRAGAALLASGQPPEAVFAANDMMALGCLFALNAAGVRVPEDIALAGFDDSPLAGCMHPALTTMRIEIGELGKRAVRLLLEQSAAGDMPPCRTQIVPQLVVRASTAGQTR